METSGENSLRQADGIMQNAPVNTIARTPSSVSSGAVSGSADLSLHHDDMNDVMTVLDLDEYAEDVDAPASSKLPPDPMTSVQEVSRLVDKSTLAHEKFVRQCQRQKELELRLASLIKKINELRCVKLSEHVAEEIAQLRAYCDKFVPRRPLPETSSPLSRQMPMPTPGLGALQPQPQPPPLALTPYTPPPPPLITPRLDSFGFPVFHPPVNIPEGVVLPSEPSPQVTPPSVPISLPTTPLAPSSLQDLNLKIKKELPECTPVSPSAAFLKNEHLAKPLAPTFEEKMQRNEILGQLDAGLKHLISSYDSDATESSSGGESCDELDDYHTKRFYDEERNFLSIRKRCKWRWLSSRASIASKWSWLTAQISDLEYRIRQQTELYRQVRASKGIVAFEDVIPLETPELPVHAVPVTRVVQREFSRLVDSEGRKILIKEPIPSDAVDDEEFNDRLNEKAYHGCSRTRPLKHLLRRRILSTKNLFITSSRAAKESTVRCDCIHPFFSCAICFGRVNHMQMTDPVSQERGRVIALLDHSYHQVLSNKKEVSLDLQMSHRIKNRTWLSVLSLGSGSSLSAGSKKDQAKKRKNKKKAKEGNDAKDPKAKKKATKRRVSEGSGLPLKKKQKLLQYEKRRKSLTVHMDMHDLIDNGELDGDGCSPAQTPSSLSFAEQIRRKRETAFDIDNIVIPYSIAASVRVEKLKYKEILTPTWRLIDDDSAAAQCGEFDDLDDATYEARHLKAEIEERKRWQLPSLKSTGGRSRNRRQDSRAEASSGCNTPDPLSPGVVDAVEVTTRPSSPINNDDSNLSSAGSMSAASSIRNRRRTSSATKSRDRNPSEDTQSSRCASPIPSGDPAVQEDIPPYEPRKFPLTDEEYNSIVEESPSDFDASDSGSTLRSSNVHLPSVLSSTCQESGSPLPASSSIPSSDDEEAEDDPDWVAEDAHDPEWSGPRADSTLQAATAAVAAATEATTCSSSSSSSSSSSPAKVISSMKK